MNIKCLVADVTAFGSPDREEPVFWGDFGWAFFCQLMKLDWLVTDVGAVGSPDRAERAILRVTFAGHFFGQFRPYLWPGSHFVM